jgi:DUF1009 family protein
MQLSRFLPDSYDPSRPTAILAGRGDYPTLMAERMRSAGVETRLIAVGGETDEAVWSLFEPNRRTSIKIGQTQKNAEGTSGF